MKVYELITELSKFAAGDEVLVCTPFTLYADILGVCMADDGKVGIDADESLCVDEDGEEIGLLSTVVNGK